MVRAETEGALRPGSMLARGRWEWMRLGRHRECPGVQRLVAGVESILVALLMSVISSPELKRARRRARAIDNGNDSSIQTQNNL
jgi:hypothetical protein